jgi:sodium transport system permease protein
MNWRRIRTVFRKELVDALRDRRTIISTIIVPIILFPLLTIGFGAVAAKAVKKMSQETPSVMILGAEYAPDLAAQLATNRAFTVTKPRANYVAEINDKQLRAAVEIPPGFEAALLAGNAPPPEIKICHYASEMRSEFAVRALQKALLDYRDQIVAKRLRDKGMNSDVLRPFETLQQNVASAKKVGGNLLGGLVPYMLILLCLVGAMNPAMDITAGEKERGTIETILASPITRLELVLGKFFMVLTMSLCTTVISLLSYGLTFSLPFFALRELTKSGPVSLDLSLGSVLSLFVLVVPLAIMFSGLLLATSVFAKSYKEAQSYVSPLMALVIIPAVAVMMPGVDLNFSLAMIPILNVSLVCKEVLSGTYHWGLISIVFLSSCGYAAIALSLAVHFFKKEAVLFRS